MKCPNRVPMIVGAVIGVAALVCCLLLPKGANEDPSLQATEPTGSGIHIQQPTDPTGTTEVPPIVIVPGDEDPIAPKDPSVPAVGDPFVDSGEAEELIKTPDDDEPVPDDEVIDVGKEENEEPDVTQGEIRNDAVLEEKEEANPPAEEEYDVIVEDETVCVGDGKGEVHEEEDKPNPNGNESNKNAPEYQPPAGGDNPFDDDIETEIEDTPVEDLIGEGEDRPGEGIHF